MLALRLREGLQRAKCAERFKDGTELYESVLQKAKRMPKPLIEVNEEKIALTAEGFLVSNAILAEILPEE